MSYGGWPRSHTPFSLYCLASSNRGCPMSRDFRGVGTRPPSVRGGQARFYGFNVWTSRKRVEKLRYMHRNPVKRGLVESPELWQWSSYRAYALAEAGVVRVNDWEVLKLKIRTPAA